MLGVFEVHPLLLCEQSGCWPRWPCSGAAGAPRGSLKRRQRKQLDLDVHIEKNNGDNLRRQRIKSWTGCSESKEQLVLHRYRLKMISLSDAWLCILPLMGQQILREGEEKEVGHNNLDIMAGITMEPLGSLP